MSLATFFGETVQSTGQLGLYDKFIPNWNVLYLAIICWVVAEYFIIRYHRNHPDKDFESFVVCNIVSILYGGVLVYVFACSWEWMINNYIEVIKGIGGFITALCILYGLYKIKKFIWTHLVANKRKSKDLNNKGT